MMLSPFPRSEDARSIGTCGSRCQISSVMNGMIGCSIRIVPSRISEATACAVCFRRWIIGIVETLLDKFNIPITKLVPEEFIERVRCIAKTEFLKACRYRFHCCVKAAANPPITQDKICRLTGLKVIEVHQQQTRSIPDLVGEPFPRLNLGLSQRNIMDSVQRRIPARNETHRHHIGGWLAPGQWRYLSTCSVSVRVHQRPVDGDKHDETALCPYTGDRALPSGQPRRRGCPTRSPIRRLGRKF